MTTQVEPQLSTETAIRYLNLYVGEADWGRHIGALWAQLSKKHPEAEAKAHMRKRIACAVLLPMYDRTKIPELPENLLFWCASYQQYDEKDWFKLLQDVIKRDEEISQWRLASQRLGVIYPIVYAPWPRQAYNWLYKAAEDSGAVTPETKEQIEKRFERLVLSYGGLVICHIFQKEEAKIKKRVLNWRTGYFFERLIFEIYDIDQVLKIKKQELSKTNETLVKKIQN